MKKTETKEEAMLNNFQYQQPAKKTAGSKKINIMCNTNSIQEKRIKTLQGHLTTADKKAIKAILALGILSGKVGRKSYFISQVNELYAVRYIIKDRGMMPVPGSKPRLSTYNAVFKMQ